MARTTTNYGYNISEGNDPVNPLVDIFPNWDAIDGDLKDVSDAAVTEATELLTGTVHALTRVDTDRNVIVFTATSNYTAGETFTVDGTQVTALTPDGQTLATGSYIIGSSVFALLKGTLLTVYVGAAKAKDSDKLDGEDSSYYATASDLNDLDNAVDAISTKVGTAVLQTTAPDLSGAVNELNSNLSKHTMGTRVDITSYTDPDSPYTFGNDGYVVVQSPLEMGMQITTNYGGYVTETLTTPSANAPLTQSTFVRKDMHVYNTRTTGASGFHVWFIPLT